MYVATTTLVVQESQGAVITASDLNLSSMMASTYTRIVTTTPVLEQVIAELELPYTPQLLRSKVSASAVGSSQLINIAVHDGDASRAAKIANRVADVFITKTQADRLADIARLQAVARSQGLEDTQVLVQAQLLAVGSLRVLEPAVVPLSPVQSSTSRNILLAIIAGMVAGVVLAFGLDYLDDRVKTPEQLRALTGLPTFGSVPLSKKETPLWGESVRNMPIEAYKFLRTNLELAALDSVGPKTIVVTSAGPREGKSTTAANLATAIAREGNTVILIDTDLHRPSLHRMFDLGNQRDLVGVTNVLMGKAGIEGAEHQTRIPSLRIIPSGPLPPEPSRVLRSEAMRQFVETVKGRADFVIFDSPPLLAVSDPIILATLTDAALLVVDRQNTRRRPLAHAVENLLQAKPRIVGAVMNKTVHREDSYYGYYYYRYYTSDDGQRTRHRRGRNVVTRLLGGHDRHKHTPEAGESS